MFVSFWILALLVLSCASFGLDTYLPQAPQEAQYVQQKPLKEDLQNEPLFAFSSIISIHNKTRQIAKA